VGEKSCNHLFDSGVAPNLDVWFRVGYSSSAMHSETGLWVEAGLLLLTFFVVVPSIAAAIGYAAWKGKPKSFNREMYWTAFAAAAVVSLFLMVFAQRMHADVRTWLYLVQVACFGLGALLFGVAGGCMVSIFTYRRGAGTQDPPRPRNRVA
jgi:hypothetical protein